MLRFKFRTLLIVLTLGPPVVAGGWWTYATWKSEQERAVLSRGTWATTRGPEPPPGTVETVSDGWQLS